MMSHLDINQLIQKTRRYEFSDGLRDMQLAILFGFGGLGVWLAFEPFWMEIIGNAVKTFGRWAVWIGMLPVILTILAVWGMLWIMNYLRRRWLWRESGMVQASRWVVPTRVNVISFLIILGGLVVGLAFRFVGWAGDAFVLRMLWGATGWGFGYTLAEVGRDIGLRRYIWIGVAGGLLSSVILFLPLNFGKSSLMFGLIWFALLMTSGIITLRSVVLEAKVGHNG